MQAVSRPHPFFLASRKFFGERKNRFLFLFFSMFVFGDGIAAFFLFLLVVCGLGHRQISPSPALHPTNPPLRRVLSRIAPLSLYHVQRGYKRQRSARYVKKCLGWHFECRTRRVPTLRISTAHRTFAGVAHAASSAFFLEVMPSCRRHFVSELILVVRIVLIFIEKHNIL